MLHQAAAWKEERCEGCRVDIDLNKDIVYKLTKLDAALQRCNIRISNYVSTTDGKSYQKVVEKISEGVTDPKVLVSLIHGRTINRVGTYVRGNI